MKILREFKEFAVRGNVIDLAVGLIIGAAFNKIVGSQVEDIVMPTIGLLVGNVDFSELDWELKAPAAGAEAVAIRYGQFINTILDFVIVALAVFLVIRQINRMKRQETPPPANTRNCPYCISVIDLQATRCPNCTSEIGGGTQ